MFSYGLVGRGGDAVQTLGIIRALQYLGHEVKVIGPHPLQPYAFRTAKSKVRTLLRRLPWWARDLVELGLNLRTLYLTQQMLRQERFDLVFHRAGIYDFVGFKIAERAPVVVYLDAPFPIERAFRREGYFRCLHNRAMYTLGKGAHLIVTVSQASREYFCGLGLPREKIIVMPNGIPEKLYQQGLVLAEDHPPFSKGMPWTIGFVGSLSPWHRVDLLLKAVSLLEVNEFKVTIIGHGEEYAKLRAMAKKLGIEERVNWLGPMPHEKAVQQMVQFDVAVLPGTLSTGAPIKIFEYAAVARPTIAPDLPNLRAWFTDDEIYFVKPGDPEELTNAIRSLCASPAKARQMGLRAQERVAHYTWEKILQQILDAFQFTSLEKHVGKER